MHSITGRTALVQAMVKHDSIAWSDRPITLAGGGESNLYVYFRSDVTDDPIYRIALCGELRRIVRGLSLAPNLQPCLLPVPTAGTLLTECMSTLDAVFHPKPPFIATRPTYKEPKSHGPQRAYIGGVPREDQHYIFVEAVATTGTSTTAFIERVREEGYCEKPPHCVVLLARNRHVETRIRNVLKGGRVVILFTLPDVLATINNGGMWQDTARASEAYDEAMAEWYR